MTNDTEPRALGAALAAPAFVTRGHGVAIHAANRHVERWAPETTAKRVRSMHTLGFVDRLVAPWVETAQRSASLRLFSQYTRGGVSEREASPVSWVFPRPWYQDELDWMAAARQVHAQSSSEPGTSAQVAPTMLTTRGTFVAPGQAPQAAAIAAPPVAMPSALYEYVAPSLSLAASQPAAIPGVGFGGGTTARHDAYSPLIPLAAVHAADLMSRMVAPLAVQRAGGGPTAITPGLRSVLTSILERAAAARMPAGELPTTRLAMSAPELVTPPAPRPGDTGLGQAMDGAGGALAAHEAAASSSVQGAMPSGAFAGESAAQVAERYAEQRARIVELQHLAQQSAQREAAARAESAARAQAGSAAAAPAPAAGDAGVRAGAPAAQTAGTAEAQVAQAELRAAAERAEAELRHRAEGPRATDAQRQLEAQRHADLQRQAEAAREAEAERARIETRIAQRVAERTGAQRLHEQARAEAAVHARTPIDVRVPDAPRATPLRAELPAEVTAAIAGLPPELSALLGPNAGARPEQTMQAISQLNDTLRTVELLARSSAAGVPFEAIRGPRLVMPAGLGGLISAVDRAQAIADRPAALAGERMLAPLPQLAAGQMPLDPRAAAASAARPAREVRVPSLSWLAPAPGPSFAGAPATALAATATATPAALSHVAWADRWLARFSGAAPRSLDAMSAAGTAAPALRMAALASAAPDSVFVVPDFARGDQNVEQAARFEAMARAAALADAPVGTAAAAAAAAAAQSMVPAPRLINPLPAEPLRRFDDGAETPDDVFMAISAAAARSRSTAAQAGVPRPAAPIVVSTTPGAEPVDARPTYADLVAHSAPAAPGPGFAAQLAASPFAPALRHVVPLPSASSFDVRSLFGAGLGATYLAGLIAPTSHQLEIGVQRTPTWASWAEAPLAQLGADQLDRLVPSFEPAYVSPSFDDAAPGVAGAPDDAAAAAWQSLVAAEAATAEATSAAVATAAAQAAAATAAATTALSEAARAAAASYAASTDASRAASFASSPAAAAAAAASVPLTTLRSALLSWEVAADEQGAPQLVPGSFAGTAGVAASYAGAPSGQAGTTSAYREMVAQLGGAARTMLEAMSQPMLGDVALDQPAAWAAPGMLASRAQSWSVAQERSTSDLALDFVAPELVAAARLYGLGPAEAAQAVRLAVVGQGQLGAMASTVDRTFVEAMTIGREARMLEAERQQRLAAGLPFTGEAGVAAEAGAMSPEAAAQIAQARERAAAAAGIATTAAAEGRAPAGVTAGIPDAPGQAPAAITTAFPAPDGTIAAAIAPARRAPLPGPSGVSFGVGRAMPRGAFLWPAATVAALGMNAGGAEGESLMSVAALELLAAQVVAELGTFTALAEADAAARGGAGMSGFGVDGGAWGTAGGDAIGAGLDGSAGASVEDGPSARLAARAAALAATSTYASAAPGAVAGQPAGAAGAAWPTAGAPAAIGGDAAVEPREADVLGAAAAMVPESRRGRFEALYVALSNSSAGRSWSPAARAARALALAGRTDEPVTARERAASAWDVLPVVYAGIAGAGMIGAGAGAFGEAGAPEAGASAASAAAAMSEAMASSYVAPSGPGASASGSSGGPRGVAGGARSQRTGGRDLVAPDSGGGADVSVSSSGMSGLSARAGDALGAYVTPVAAPAMPRDRSGDGAMLRAPSATPEYVRTGGRHGGGEVEIPSWFEAAARKMLAERSGDGISMAELTLVTAAPASHIAAAAIQPSPAPTAPSASANPGQQGAGGNAPQIDVEKLAHDVYRDILLQMEIARARNGDSFL